jgi:tetratricopeptide (TPR) repeat protein
LLVGKYHVIILLIAACLSSCCYFSFWLAGAISPFISFNTGLFGILIGLFGVLCFPAIKKKTISLIFFIIITVVIIYSGSRTGLFSWFTGIFFLLLFTLKLSVYQLRKFFISVFIILAGFFIISAFFFKTDSTKGRLFIWQNCFAIIKQNWLTGVGWGQFRMAYNEQQANWFMQHGFQNKESMLADTIYYAFNEWLQIAFEIGLPLAFIIVGGVLFILIRAIRNVMKPGNSYTDQKVVAAFTAMLFSSFFSYPFYYLPTLLLFIFLFIWVIKIAKFSFIYKQSVLIKQMAAISLFVLVSGFLSIQYYARMQWKNATELSGVGYKKLALIKMKKAYPVLISNGDYLFSLATIYSSLNKVDSALLFLELSGKTKNDYDLHRKLGQLSTEAGNQVLAERHFLKAVYMVPNRFRSREMLVDFYVQTKQINKAIYWAQESLKFPVKIKSHTIDAIKKRFRILILKKEW